MGSDVPEDLPEALARAREDWLAAANASDVDAYASCLTEDAVWLPPGMEAIHGRGAIHTFLAGIMEGLSYRLELAEVQVHVAGAWAREEARFHTTMTDEATGRQMEHRGAYLMLWRREEDGAWRIDRYVDRSQRTSG